MFGDFKTTLIECRCRHNSGYNYAVSKYVAIDAISLLSVFSLSCYPENGQLPSYTFVTYDMTKYIPLV